MADSKKHRAYLALGGNLGDPRQAFGNACQKLTVHPQIKLHRSSSLYRTPAIGGPAGQPDYLNAVIEIATDLEPEQLLETCLQIEATAGRTRGIRWAARTLDIDLLFIDNLTLNTESLTLPHPLIQKRHFVLLPLVEIAPDLQHPQFGCSVSRLLKDLPAADGITRLTEKWIDHD